MKVALISNVDNGKGLQRDCEVLRDLFVEHGCDVDLVHFQGGADGMAERYDLGVFVETVVPWMFDCCERTWLVPNPEWWEPEWDHALTRIDRVLCKTPHAVEVFESDAPGRCVLTGFIGADAYNAQVKREKRCLHIAGGSTAKGTISVLDAWRRHGDGLPPLTVVAAFPVRNPPAGVEVIRRRLLLADLRALQNRCRIHVQPSEYEGWGHVIHESLSTGAAVVTASGPSTANIAGVAGVASSELGGAHGRAMMHQVDPDELASVVREVASARHSRKKTRAVWQAEQQSAREAIGALIDSEKRRPSVDVWPLNSGRYDAGGPLDAPRLAICLPAPPTWADIVVRTAAALAGQTVHPSAFELAVALDGGTEADAEALRGRLAGLPYRCTVVTSARPEGEALPHRNHARNAAWRASSAPLCWTLDCDFLLPPHAVEHVLIEHDRALARGAPAVFTPCLVGIPLPPGEWLDRSSVAVDRLGMAAALSGLDLSDEIWSGFPEHFESGPPASKVIGELPEGQPVVWRGLLEALDGYDERFVGWGADKEEFISRLRGVQRAGLIEIRLLTSVAAVHQPHATDANDQRQEVQARQVEHERRVRLIANNAAWWRTRLARVQATLDAAIEAARPAALPGLAADPEQDMGAVPVEVDAAIRYTLRGPLKRRRGLDVLVCGRWSAQVAHIVAKMGANPRIVTEPPSRGSADALLTVDALRDEGRRRGFAHALRPKATVVLLERTRRSYDDAPRPLDYQQQFPGLQCRGADKHLGGGETLTLLHGRMVRTPK